MDAAVQNDVQVLRRPGPSAKAVAGLVLLAAFTTFITWRARVVERTLQEQSEEPTLVDKPAPDFSAATPDGRIVSLADFRGQKRVVVSFWASWCGPCRLEMPLLTKFYQDNHTASSDFEILAVSIDEDPRDAAAFATTQKLKFPVLLDPHQKMAKAYEVDGIPTLFVIDKDGKITHGHIGYDLGLEWRLKIALRIRDQKRTEGAADGNAGH